MFPFGIDWPWVLIIAGFWLALGVAAFAVIYAAGWLLARRDERLTARRPAAPVIPLDLHRARRQSARGGYIHHHGNTPGGTAA